jgi:CheY-like chemotaxis protein
VPRTPTRAKPVSLEGLKVLIVEDNKVNQKIVQRMMLEERCICDLASHGKEALDLTSIYTYDLILMDIEMPIVGGLEATRILRRQENTVPVIGLSGFAQDKDKKQALEAGMDDYLTKPFTKEELHDMIVKHVINKDVT